MADLLLLVSAYVMFRVMATLMPEYRENTGQAILVALAGILTMLVAAVVFFGTCANAAL